MSESPRRGGGRRRPPPQLVEVVRVARVSPRLVSVHVGGGDLSRFADAAPTSHLKVFLPAPGQSAPALPAMTDEGRVWPEGAPRPAVRTYTPRSYDPVAGTLEVQFVLHGEGPASEWAGRAATGDKIAIGGPGGRFAVDPGAKRWWIGGDESALPAIGTLLDALPAGASADVHVEVAGAEDEIPLTGAADVTVTWHHRRGPEEWGVSLRDAAGWSASLRDAAGWGASLRDAAARAAIDDGTHVWVACEASAVRAIRRDLMDRGLPREALVTRGYWRAGMADHPDHDYGED